MRGIGENVFTLLLRLFLFIIKTIGFNIKIKESFVEEECKR